MSDNSVQVERYESAEADAHKWISNPLDWRPIERLIVLGVISQLLSIIFVVVIFLALAYQANNANAVQYLNVSVGIYMLICCASHLILNFVFTFLAFGKRRKTHDWPLYTYEIVFSFVIMVLVLSYATGTYFSDGIVLLLFGLALCLPLVDLDILTRVYIFAWIGFIALMIVDFGELIVFAPLFSLAPMDGLRPVFGWHVLRVMISFLIFFVLFFVTLPTTRRWREREDLYREMSNTDGLTRLANRRSFIDRSNVEFSKLKRMPGMVACIMIDLDYFKKINDNYGHQAGDKVLVKVAETLARNAREYDEVGRYGGEEFALLLPNTSKENAAKLAERIRVSIEEIPIDIGDKTLRVTASFGVAGYPAEGIENVDDLLKRADQALYKAKEKSRNVVVIAED